MQPKTNFLTRNQKAILKTRHRHERDKRLCDLPISRMKVISEIIRNWVMKCVS